MMGNKKMPYKLQFFAEGEGNNGADQGNQEPAGGQQNQEANTQKAGQGSAPEIDYTKLSELIAGKQKVSEDSVLKGYFKQQGLSGEEMQQAIKKFKVEKAANEPNMDEISRQRDEALSQLQQVTIQNAATLEAVKMGIKEETVPFLMKLADFDSVLDEKGNIKDGAIKEAIDNVLKAVPQFKPSEEDNNTGFHIGGSGNGGEQQTTQQAGNAVKKRWNRFN